MGVTWKTLIGDGSAKESKRRSLGEPKGGERDDGVVRAAEHSPASPNWTPTNFAADLTFDSQFPLVCSSPGVFDGVHGSPCSSRSRSLREKSRRRRDSPSTRWTLKN